MLSPLATREVSGSLGRQLWMKQKDATIAKVSCWRGTGALCTCKRSRAACGCTALTRFCVPRYTPQLQREALAPDRPTSTFSILPLDFSNFMLRFGNTPVGTVPSSAVACCMLAWPVLGG